MFHSSSYEGQDGEVVWGDVGFALNSIKGQTLNADT